MLQSDPVSVVSLDYDLHVPGMPTATGLDVVLWIEQCVLADTAFIAPEIRLHSANRFGSTAMHDVRKRIERVLLRRKLGYE